MPGSLWSRLKAWTARSAASPTAAPIAAPDAAVAIDIHEDDWGMRTLHPIGASAEAAAALRAAIEAGERNREPSGAGWTGVHVIRPPSTSYAEAGLRLADAAAALAPIMPRVRSFNAGPASMPAGGKADPWASHDRDAWAFGLGAHCYLKLEPAGEHVETIWFGLASTVPADIAALRAAIEAIDRLVPSVIVDHLVGAMAPVADGALADRYFARLGRY